LTCGMDYFAWSSLYKANLRCRRILREEVSNAFRNATACSEDLYKEVNVSSSSMPPTSMALVAPQHRVLRPQRAVKNLALEMVLWRNETEPTKVQSTADYPRRSTSAASHQHSIDNTDTGINDQAYDPRDRRGIPRAEAPTTLNSRPRRSAMGLGEPRIMKEQHSFERKISVVRRLSQNEHDSQTKPYQSAISPKALLEAGIPFDEDEGIPHFEGGNLSGEEIQELVKRTEQIEKEAAAAAKFVSEPLQETHAGIRKASPTQAPKQTRARPNERDEVYLSTRSDLRPHKGRRYHMAPRAESPIRGQSNDYNSDASVVGSLRASSTGAYYDSDDSDALARIDPRSRRTSREYRADYGRHGARRIVAGYDHDNAAWRRRARDSAEDALRQYRREEVDEEDGGSTGGVCGREDITCRYEHMAQGWV
jgi:hypothetical protein